MINLFRFFKTAVLILLFLEIAVFILVGNLIGFFPTFLLVIASMLLGGAILREHKLQQVQQLMRNQQPIALAIFDNLLIGLAGLLLIIPGFITDIIALLLLSTRLRVLIKRWLMRKGIVVSNQAPANDAPTNNTQHNIMEGEFWREDDKQK